MSEVTTMKSDMVELSREELEKRLIWYSKRYGQYIEKRGFHNFKNLFRAPNLYEWTILFMLFMAGFIAWAYMADISRCQETLENLDGICIEYCSSEFRVAEANEQARQEFTKLGEINYSQIIVKADNQSSDEG